MNNNVFFIVSADIAGILNSEYAKSEFINSGVFTNPVTGTDGKIKLRETLIQLSNSRYAREATHLNLERDICIESDEDFIEALKEFKRIGNDRIKLIIYTNRNDDDSLHSDLVSIVDIKDIISSFVDEKDYVSKIKYAVLQGATYNDTEKYRRKAASTNTPDETTDNNDVVVIEKEIIRTLDGYIQIGLAGNVKRMGTSSMALSLGVLLSEEGYKVAVFEYNNHFYTTEDDGTHVDKSYYEMLSDEPYIKQRHDDYLEYKKMHIYPTQGQRRNLDILADIKGSGYQYIIIDFGIFGEIGFDKGEFNSSHGKIIVTGTKVHEVDLTEIFEQRDEVLKNYRFLVNLSDKALKSDYEKQVNQKAEFAPYTPNPFAPKPELLMVIDDLLIEKKKKKRKRRGLF